MTCRRSTPTAIIAAVGIIVATEAPGRARDPSETAHVVSRVFDQHDLDATRPAAGAHPDDEVSTPYTASSAGDDLVTRLLTLGLAVLTNLLAVGFAWSSNRSDATRRSNAAWCRDGLPCARADGGC